MHYLEFQIKISPKSFSAENIKAKRSSVISCVSPKAFPSHFYLLLTTCREEKRVYEAMVSLVMILFS